MTGLRDFAGRRTHPIVQAFPNKRLIGVEGPCRYHFHDWPLLAAVLGRRPSFATPGRSKLMTRRLLILLTSATVLAAPAGAAAADTTLLSGYGGPGSGEQSLLGGTLLPAPRGNGSLRAAGAPAAGDTRTTPAPARGGPSTASSAGDEPSTDPPASATAKEKRTAAGRGRVADKTSGGTADAVREKSAAAGQVAAGRTVSYPPANDASSFPAGGSDLLLVLIGLIVLVAVGTLTSGLARTQPPRPDNALR